MFFALIVCAWQYVHMRTRTCIHILTWIYCILCKDENRSNSFPWFSVVVSACYVVIKIFYTSIQIHFCTIRTHTPDFLFHQHIFTYLHTLTRTHTHTHAHAHTHAHTHTYIRTHIRLNIEMSSMMKSRGKQLDAINSSAQRLKILVRDKVSNYVTLFPICWSIS